MAVTAHPSVAAEAHGPADLYDEELHHPPLPESLIDRRRALVLAIFFLPPVGAILAWLLTFWPTWVKLLVTGWALMVVLMTIGFLTDIFAPGGSQIIRPASIGAVQSLLGA